MSRPLPWGLLGFGHAGYYPVPLACSRFAKLGVCCHAAAAGRFLARRATDHAFTQGDLNALDKAKFLLTR